MKYRLLTFNEFLKFLSDQEVNLDANMVFKLPFMIAFGKWPDGRDKIATHFGAFVDESGRVTPALFQLIDGVMYAIDIETDPESRWVHHKQVRN